MSQIDPEAAAVLALARAGDVAGAIAAGERALAGRRADPGLALFVGMLCGRAGDLARGIPHLRRAVALAPREVGAKVELARALVATGEFAEAEAVATPLASLASPAGREMYRIQAQAALRQARPDEARALYAQLTDADGADFESWDGLGAALLAAGEFDAAIEALRRATRLRPTAVAYWINLARAYASAQDFAAGVDAARKALAGAPSDVAAHLEHARSLAGLARYDEAQVSLAVVRAAESGNPDILSQVGDIGSTCRSFDQAGVDYRAALALRPDLTAAWVGLGKLLERNNRIDELFELLDAAAAAGVPADATALLRARALRGAGRLEEALAAAQAAPAEIDRADRAQLVGDIADRLRDTDTAFAAFTEANDVLAAHAVGSAEAAANYLATFGKLRELMTSGSYARWAPPLAADGRRSPLFIFGFPRSGTTLIDTMLGGHPDAVVMEEEPVIDTLAAAMGAIERLPTLAAPEIQRLRDRYFAEVDKIVPDVGSRLIVDKHPLGLANTPLLHRIFPDARFVFVERHPCDVVLSCFITSSQMDAKIASFFDFAGTARLYDRVLAFWSQCTEVLPIDVHVVRYETLIAEPEAELRKLARFADLEWTPKLLDNQANANERVYIGSPSYAQVAQPIYQRAKGRWLRYRRHMEPVIPILAPWIERLGYDLD